MTRDEAIRRALERTPSISCRQYVRDFRPELAGPIFGNRAAMTEAHRLTGSQVIEALGPWAQASVQAYRDADPSWNAPEPHHKAAIARGPFVDMPAPGVGRLEVGLDFPAGSYDLKTHRER